MTSLFSHTHTHRLYTQKIQENLRQTITLNVSNVAGYTLKIQKSVVFMYNSHKKVRYCNKKFITATKW